MPYDLLISTLWQAQYLHHATSLGERPCQPLRFVLVVLALKAVGLVNVTSTAKSYNSTNVR